MSGVLPAAATPFPANVLRTVKAAQEKHVEENDNGVNGAKVAREGDENVAGEVVNPSMNFSHHNKMPLQLSADDTGRSASGFAR